MVRIKDVMFDYDEALPVFGAALMINLDNNGTIFVSIESKADDPAYAAFRYNKRLPEPITDGESVYWPDGPRLTLSEIMEMLQNDEKGDST